MIQKTDLRIGNIVSYEATAHVIRALHHDVVLHSWAKGGDNYYSSYNQIEGFPLTPEWLDKLGFTVSSNNLVYDHPTPKVPEDEHKDLGTCYPSFFFNERLGRWMDCHTRVCVDHIHQLQNLYFALTGEELTLKQ